MNPQIKRLFFVVFVMFLSLMVACTYIQFLGADSLNADGRNSRAFYRSKYIERGPIMVGENAIAASEPTKDSTGYRKRYHRVYSEQAPLYSNLTGYLSPGGNATGMERLQNSVLMGEASSQALSQLLKYAAGENQKGGGILLTIDPQIQQAAAQALGNHKGAVVALNYQSGAILAAVTTPRFNPSSLATGTEKQSQQTLKQLQADPSKPMLDRALRGEYPPGSAFKIITAAAALEQQIRTPEDAVDAPVSVPLPGSRAKISNIESTRCGNGHPTFTYAFAYSCNTPFAKIGQDLGYQALKDKTEAFGFNPKSDLKIPLPVQNSYFPSSDPGIASTMMSAIGQYEVRTSPLMVATVAAAVANQGTQMRPFLVAAELGSDGKATRTYRSGGKLGKPISKEVAAQLRQMMIATVTEGTGEAGRVAGVEMGAKTGTAQTGGNKTDAWYVGWADTPNLPLAFAVVIEGDNSNPTPHGGPVAGPVAKQVVQAAMNHD